MPVRFEFYGIPRLRAGRATLEVEAASLGEAITQLSEQLPQLAETCIGENGRLKGGYLANINGKTFTTDPATPLQSGDFILLLSADVGG